MNDKELIKKRITAEIQIENMDPSFDLSSEWAEKMRVKKWLTLLNILHQSANVNPFINNDYYNNNL